MTKNNYKNTVLTVLLMVPLFSAGIAIGNFQNAYAGICSDPPPIPSIDPLEVRETLDPGVQFPITKFFDPHANDCFQFVEFNVSFGNNCFRQTGDVQLSVSWQPFDPTRPIFETINVRDNAEPGEYHCDVIWTSEYEEGFNEGLPVFTSVTQPIWITVGSPVVTLVEIDIKPGSDPNSINTKSGGVIPVAILGSDTFDVADVDVSTLAFGPDTANPRHDLSDGDTLSDHTEDVNGDGIDDLVSHYKTNETGIAPGDAEACISGELLDGTSFEGCDSVNAVK